MGLFYSFRPAGLSVSQLAEIVLTDARIDGPLGQERSAGHGQVRSMERRAKGSRIFASVPQPARERGRQAAACAVSTGGTVPRWDALAAQEAPRRQSIVIRRREGCSGARRYSTASARMPAARPALRLTIRHGRGQSRRNSHRHESNISTEASIAGTSDHSPGTPLQSAAIILFISYCDRPNSSFRSRLIFPAHWPGLGTCNARMARSRYP